MIISIIFFVLLFIVFEEKRFSFIFLFAFFILLYFCLKIYFLKKFGQKIQAEVKEFEIIDTGLPRMGYVRDLRYRAILEWKNQTTGEIHIFKSYKYHVPFGNKNGDLIMAEPKQFLDLNGNRLRVNVFTHPKNFKYYFVDFPNKLLYDSIFGKDNSLNTNL